METKTQIIEKLEILNIFFDEHNERGWSERTRMTIEQLIENKIDTKSILNNFIGAGMGSIIDLYICKENGHILKHSEEETNKQLNKLTEQILKFKTI